MLTLISYPHAILATIECEIAHIATTEISQYHSATMPGGTHLPFSIQIPFAYQMWASAEKSCAYLDEHFQMQ
jgi:hypothetical protein